MILYFFPNQTNDTCTTVSPLVNCYDRPVIAIIKDVVAPFLIRFHVEYLYVRALKVHSITLNKCHGLPLTLYCLFPPAQFPANLPSLPIGSSSEEFWLAQVGMDQWPRHMGPKVGQEWADLLSSFVETWFRNNSPVFVNVCICIDTHGFLSCNRRAKPCGKCFRICPWVTLDWRTEDRQWLACISVPPAS